MTAQSGMGMMIKTMLGVDPSELVAAGKQMQDQFGLLMAAYNRDMNELKAGQKILFDQNQLIMQRLELLLQQTTRLSMQVQAMREPAPEEPGTETYVHLNGVTHYDN